MSQPVLSGMVTSDPEPWPEGAVYHSPLGLFGFQADGVAQTYWQCVEGPDPVADVLWQTGTGKTHLVLATNALMAEDKVVDQVIIVAEANKVVDWVNDYAKFTKIDAVLYAGSPAKRAEILTDPPSVLVMTYETGRNDICTFAPKSKAVLGPKMLTEALMGKRVLIVFDEFTKLRSRGIYLYVAWNYLINRVLRRQKVGKTMVVGLTATKIESNPEDHFSANLLLAPWLSPSVAQFQAEHIASWDMFGNPSAFKNLNPDQCEPGVIPLSTRYTSITLKKRKSDPDVIGHFPAKVEQPPRYIKLGARHREFYDAVQDLFGESDIEILQSFGLLRQIAADPISLLRSKGALATQIVDTIGAQALTAMGSAKSDEMLAWTNELGGEQGVIFTFFGQSVLPTLAERLRSQKVSVSVNHGQMSPQDRGLSQDAFKAGDSQIFLSSDAGARGLNLGCGSALLHYELPLLYSTFVQRSDRIHRIDSIHESVTIDALVAKDTVEESIARLLIKRNGWSDAVLDDDAYVEGYDPGEALMSAEMRKELWARARRLAA